MQRRSASANRPPYRVGRSYTGLGLFATDAIEEAALIVEYSGPRVPTTEAHARERAGRSKYMFEVSPPLVDRRGRPRHAAMPTTPAGRTRSGADPWQDLTEGGPAHPAGRGNHLRLRPGIRGGCSSRPVAGRRHVAPNKRTRYCGAPTEGPNVSCALPSSMAGLVGNNDVLCPSALGAGLGRL